MRTHISLLLLALTLPALAAPVEILRDRFDGKSLGTLMPGATVAPGRDGPALKLADQGSVIYEGAEFPAADGRIELDLCPYAAITPRPNNHHWMLLTDVGAGSAWKGATVIYWDSQTAQLNYGVFDGGWRWLPATGVTWTVGQWRHLAFTFGPKGRTLEVDGQVVGRDGLSDGISPHTMRLGTMDTYTTAAPLLIQNFVVSAEPVDALKLTRGVVCPGGNLGLDSVTARWSLAADSDAGLELCTKAGRPLATWQKPAPTQAGVHISSMPATPVPTGNYIVRLTLRRPGQPAKLLTAPLHVETGLVWRPAPNHMGERFPLGVWYFWEDDASYINRITTDLKAVAAYYEKTTADLASIGVNTIVGNWTPRDHRRLLLDAAQRHNLKVIVHLDEVNGFIGSPERLKNEDFITAIREAVKTARDHPATLGYYLVDEPSQDPETARNIELAKKVVEALDPVHPGFSCLLGDYAALYKQVGYQVLLVDIYPVYSARLQGDVLKGYIGAVDRAREVAAGKPMWVIPQCFGFGKPEVHGIPAPNEVSLMVWEAIAHGAKGIVYFIYQSTTGIQGEWLQGIVDMKLNPMDHRHNEVRALDAAVKAVAPTVLGLAHKPNDFATTDAALIDLQAFADKAGMRYLCVVNQNTQTETRVRLTLKPELAARTKQIEDVATGRRVGLGERAVHGDAAFDLPPGQGALLRLVPR